MYGLGKRVGGWVGGENVRREESEAEAEVGRGEDGERLDQDVGDGLIATKVGVELVAVCSEKSALRLSKEKNVCVFAKRRVVDQIELIN